MNNWARDELDRIAKSDDLHISPFREDGKTYGTPTWTCLPAGRFGLSLSTTGSTSALITDRTRAGT